MNSPLVSVIVPVYNAEKYLQRCIDSIINQTFTDFELLLINDGSQDSSGQICEHNSDRDNRIKVFYKKNGGVSSARNLGLQQAKGEWINFIDSDDFVGKEYLSNLLKGCEMSMSELIQAGFNKVSGNTSQCIKCTLQNITTLSMSEILLHLRGFSFSKLFRRDIIKQNDIKFDESLTLAEDLCFNLNYIAHINCATFINSTDYNYVTNGESASYKLHKPESLLKLWQIENLLINNLQKKFSLSNKDISAWKVETASYVISWIISWIIFNANGPFDKQIPLQLERYYEYYIDLFNQYTLNSFAKRYIANQLCNKNFRFASVLLYLISQYIKRKNNYEI